jgi:hypothetical protein
MRRFLALALVLSACSDGRSPTDPAMARKPLSSPTTSLGLITPDDPGASDVRFTLDATVTHPISPFVYGVNNLHGWPGVQLPRNLTMGRHGGNRLSAYNWETNASNAGRDYFYQNDDYLCWVAGCDGTRPGESVRHRVAGTLARGAGIIVTVPTLGYVAADKAGPTGIDEATWATRMATRFRRSVPRKGAPFTLVPDAADSTVAQDEFAWWLSQSFPGSATSARQPIFFALDNEPDLWHRTHEEVRSRIDGQPQLLTYDDAVGRAVAYASAVKDAVPGAQVFGPGVSDWSGAASLGRWPTPDPVAGTSDFLDYYLAKMRQAEAGGGRRLLDVLNMHWYPEIYVGGVRITDDAGTQTPEMIQARVQAPRSLWDPSFTENSWIPSNTGGPVRLIPRLRDKVAAHYPGTKLAITEYWYGRGGDISGGVAQADVLGIFGREGVFAATLWPMGKESQYGNDPQRTYAYALGAFRIFRDYDGQGSTFGSLGLKAATTDNAISSVYASTEPGQPGRVVMVAINKSATDRTAGIQLSTDRLMKRAEVYVMRDGQPVPARGADIALTLRNAFVYTMPAMSVTTIVLRDS